MSADILRKRYAEYRDAALRHGLTLPQFNAACRAYAEWEAEDNGRVGAPSPADWTSAALAVANASRFPRAQWSGIVGAAAFAMSEGTE